LGERLVRVADVAGRAVADRRGIDVADLARRFCLGGCLRVRALGISNNTVSKSLTTGARKRWGRERDLPANEP
jgi:hypothetical protein